MGKSLVDRQMALLIVIHRATWFRVSLFLWISNINYTYMGYHVVRHNMKLPKAAHSQFYDEKYCDMPQPRSSPHSRRG
jgi:hypothetical protein